jgi:predicted secreted Zn-dependent protease
MANVVPQAAQAAWVTHAVEQCATYAFAGILSSAECMTRWEAKGQQAVGVAAIEQSVSEVAG